MQTIFSSNRKHLRRSYFVRVYEQDGIIRYVAHFSRGEREHYEQQDREYLAQWPHLRSTPLYRVNVRPVRN